MNANDLKREVLAALYRNRAIQLVEAGFALEHACQRAIKQIDAELERAEANEQFYKSEPTHEPTPF